MKQGIYVYIFSFALTFFWLSLGQASRGPYLPKPENAPISKGVVVFLSKEIELLRENEKLTPKANFYGIVLTQVTRKSGTLPLETYFEQAFMQYYCHQIDDGAYGALSCRYEKYDNRRVYRFKSCDIYESSYYCQ